MLTRFPLALDKFTHELAHQLGGGPVGRLGFSHEGVAQIGFKLDGENGFLRHNFKVMPMTILRQYRCI